jgi:type 1 glutamine amidotransferase
MMRVRRLFLLAGILLGGACLVVAEQKPAHVLAFYSTNVEADHVAFAKQALLFYAAKAEQGKFTFESTTRWDDLNAARLAQVNVVLWLDDFPQTDTQRKAFEAYMRRGGAWLGFHIAAYNDADTHWPWFVDFLGGGIFYSNNWPPLPALLHVDDTAHPVMKGLPAQLLSPANEWYIWQPSPRQNKDVKVLLTLDSSNYPLGFKDVLAGGDLPVVWTNTRYRMLYMNMGHGDKIFTDATQNRLLENGLTWLIGRGK